MLSSRLGRLVQAWWHSCRAYLQPRIGVSDRQYQQQLQQKQSALAQAAAQQQLGLLEAEKRRCQQQLQQLAAEFQTSEIAASQALQQQDEPVALQHLWQLARIEQQQVAAQRQLAQLSQQCNDRMQAAASGDAAEPPPLAELQQLALQASAERHLQRLKAQGGPQ
ncbi:MAG: hypothetical protein U5L02_09050 [Rheinheimera sp.]|nr:hypothetical protein [Rheinheimera sp.]